MLGIIILLLFFSIIVVVIQYLIIFITKCYYLYLINHIKCGEKYLYTEDNIHLIEFIIKNIDETYVNVLDNNNNSHKFLKTEFVLHSEKL